MQTQQQLAQLGKYRVPQLQNKHMHVLCLAWHLEEQSQINPMLKEQEVLNRVISSIDSRSTDKTPRLHHWNIKTQQNQREQGKDNICQSAYKCILSCISQSRNTIQNAFINTLQKQQQAQSLGQVASFGSSLFRGQLAKSHAFLNSMIRRSNMMKTT